MGHERDWFGDTCHTHLNAQRCCGHNGDSHPSRGGATAFAHLGCLSAT